MSLVPLEPPVTFAIELLRPTGEEPGLAPAASAFADATRAAAGAPMEA